MTISFFSAPLIFWLGWVDAVALAERGELSEESGWTGRADSPLAFVKEVFTYGDDGMISCG